MQQKSKGGRPKLNILHDKLSKKLLTILSHNGEGLDRNELARRTGTPRTTVFDRLKKLEIAEKITWKKKQRLYRGHALPGRPKTLWMVTNNK